MRHSNRGGRALAATVTALLLAVAPTFAPSPAPAEESIVTLKGDPAFEAVEREQLFTALAASKNASEAASVAGRVWALWFRAPTTEGAALMKQALDRRAARDYPGAAAVLDELVEVEPDWAEAWNQRATIRYLLRDFEGSLADIDRVLALEPKHFGALSGQGLILMHQGKTEAGQLALRRAVEIDPFLSERALIMGPPGQDI